MGELATGLGPAGVLTLVGFSAFTHAFFIIKGGEENFGDLVLESFTTLFTGGLPSSAQVDEVYLLLTYASVIVFSLFFLNIFIGVISEQYTLAKEQVPRRFQQVLAGECSKYLLRAVRLPNIRALRRCSWPLIILLVLVMLALQVYGLYDGRPLPYTGGIFIFCIAAMIWLSYQHDVAPWKGRPDDGERFYIWVVSPKEAAQEASPEFAEVCNRLAEMSSHLEALKLRMPQTNA